MSRNAVRSDWTNRPITDAKAKLDLQRTFSLEDYSSIAKGLIPQEMEDKWFIFMEDDIVYFHRSWTGAGIFEVHLQRSGDTYKVAAAWVNRDTEDYRCADDNYSRDLLVFLIDRLLLGKDAVYPVMKGTPSGQAALAQFHTVGHGRSNKDE